MVWLCTFCCDTSDSEAETENTEMKVKKEYKRKPSKQQLDSASATVRMSLRSHSKNKKCACLMKPVKVNKSFADLRDPELYLNLQVIANDDSSTLVHSLYLCALSDKIFSMFLQCEDKKIFLNMSPNVLRSVIQLGNYGFCDISDDNIVPLMKAGKEFEIVYLSNLCGEELWRKISHSTAVDSLKLARQFLCSHIVERIEIFIRRNFSDFILEEPLQVKNIVLFYIRFRIISS